MKKKHFEYFMKVAELTAELSTAERLKVGCIIVKDGRILSIGYNGTPPGFSNTCEYHEVTKDHAGLVTKPEVIHAEANAILKLASTTDTSQGSTMFITHAPCLECSKMIAMSKIDSVIYKHIYRCTDGVDLLVRSGVGVLQYDKAY